MGKCASFYDSTLITLLLHAFFIHATLCKPAFPFDSGASAGLPCVELSDVNLAASHSPAIRFSCSLQFTMGYDPSAPATGYAADQSFTQQASDPSLAQPQQAYAQPQQAYAQPQQAYAQPQQAYAQPQQVYAQPAYGTTFEDPSHMSDHHHHHHQEMHHHHHHGDVYAVPVGGPGAHDTPLAVIAYLCAVLGCVCCCPFVCGGAGLLSAAFIKERERRNQALKIVLVLSIIGFIVGLFLYFGLLFSGSI